MAAYRRDLLAYEAWLHEHSGGGGHDAVTEQEVAGYLAHLSKAGMAPASVARAMVAVRSLHRFLVQEGEAKADPTADLKPPPVPLGLPKALSEDEVSTLLASVTGAGPAQRRDRAILEVLYGTGMRISELTGLAWAMSWWRTRWYASWGRATRSGWCLWAATPAKRWGSGQGRAEGD